MSELKDASTRLRRHYICAHRALPSRELVLCEMSIESVYGDREAEGQDLPARQADDVAFRIKKVSGRKVSLPIQSRNAQRERPGLENSAVPIRIGKSDVRLVSRPVAHLSKEPGYPCVGLIAKAIFGFPAEARIVIELSDRATGVQSIALTMKTSKQGLAGHLMFVSPSLRDYVDHSAERILPVDSSGSWNNFNPLNCFIGDEIKVDRIEVGLIDPLAIYKYTRSRHGLPVKATKIDGLLE
jgi:hypothetical protein